MAATFFGVPKKARHGIGGIHNAPADPIAQGAPNVQNTEFLCGFFHTVYCYEMRQYHD